MGADPIQATRNVAQRERDLAEQAKRADDIRILVARGLIHDLVSQLARVMANRLVTGPEEVRLQDILLRDALNYAKAIQSGPASVEYMSPVEQTRKVEEQSPGVSELKRMDAERKAAMEKIAGELDDEVQRTLAEKEPVPFALPKAKPVL
jgi:hypothetical protein